MFTHVTECMCVWSCLSTSTCTATIHEDNNTLQSSVYFAVKCVLEAGFREQVRIGSVHFESVTVIYNAQWFSAPCAGLLSLLAALSPEPAVLTGEMDVSL